jgi:hypothetical protein
MKSTPPQPRVPTILHPDSHGTKPSIKGFEGLTATDTAAREEITHRAYSIWECAGRPEHCELAHWLEAEAEVLSGA